MDAFTIPSFPVGEIVLLAIEDMELMAMMALFLEIAGYRVVPIDVLRRARTRAEEVHPRAVIADLRRGAAEDWNVVHGLQDEMSSGPGRLVVITQDADEVPGEVVHRGAAIITWPFPLTDVLRILNAP
jgi:hypothetical protein